MTDKLIDKARELAEEARGYATIRLDKEMVRAIITRLAAAEKVCEAVGRAFADPDEELDSSEMEQTHRAWRAIRDAKEGA